MLPNDSSEKMFFNHLFLEENNFMFCRVFNICVVLKCSVFVSIDKVCVFLGMLRFGVFTISLPQEWSQHNPCCLNEHDLPSQFCLFVISSDRSFLCQGVLFFAYTTF